MLSLKISANCQGNVSAKGIFIMTWGERATVRLMALLSGVIWKKKTNLNNVEMVVGFSNTISRRVWTSVIYMYTQASMYPITFHLNLYSRHWRCFSRTWLPWWEWHQLGHCCLWLLNHASPVCNRPGVEKQKGISALFIHPLRNPSTAGFFSSLVCMS